MTTYQCDCCGEEVEENDYAYIGSTKVRVCDSVDCERELRRDDEAAYEEELGRVRDEWYGDRW